jgi:carbamoyltransferase
MTVIVAVARGHNSSTTLLVDGEVVFYLEEERLSKFKYDGSPLLGLIEVFKHVDHIDHLVVCHTHRHGPTLDWTGEDLYEGMVRKLAKKKFKFETHFIDLHHHQMHAACGFYNSGFETAACVIVDGAGSFLNIDGINDNVYEFETIFKSAYPHTFDQVYKHLGTKDAVGYYKDLESENYITEFPGITKTYEAVTQYVGFPAIEAGKTMGLAPYGKPNPDLPPLFRDGWANRDVIQPTYPSASRIIHERFPILAAGVSTVPNEFTQTQMDLAYAVQEATEQAMIKLIRKAHELTGETNIVICGGYGLNCVANYKYWKEFENLNIYCEPISHDGGTSIGGAKLIWHQVSQNTQPKKQASVYYGPQYDTTEYKAVLKDNAVNYTTSSYNDIAKLIADGNIVTIFQGRSEGGPRALGNRSILFDPRVKDGKDIVNAVKHREWFRPFAGSILAESVHEWFDLAGRPDSPHMMYAVDCQPGVEEKIPSIIHVDGTCRIQTVTAEQNLHYYNLISAFDEITGTPILFNTSFNLGGDPLVETLDDAIDTLKRCDIEYLYLPEVQLLVHISNAVN